MSGTDVEGYWMAIAGCADVDLDSVDLSVEPPLLGVAVDDHGRAGLESDVAAIGRAAVPECRSRTS